MKTNYFMKVSRSDAMVHRQAGTYKKPMFYSNTSKVFRFFMLQNDKTLIINAFVISSDSEKSINNQRFVKTYRTVVIEEP
jgi:hypothetical protein